MRISDWSSDVCSSDLQAAQGALARRRRGQAAERRPQRVLDAGIGLDALVCKQALQPIGGPTAGGGIVATRQRLERDRAAAQVVMLAAQAEDGRTDRTPGVEDRTSTRLNSTHQCASRM